MQKDRILLSAPHMGGREQYFIEKAFQSNWIAPVGENITEFENSLQNYLGENKHIAALNSGTAALHLGLILLDVQPDDFVICQSFTFAATANPIVYLKAIPVFVDSEESTWNICPKALEEAIIACLKEGKKPKAIIPVHLYGMPYQVEAIHTIANKYEIPILEDSAEALGSSYKNQKCGTFGKFAALSFNGNKIITTSGGGALVTNSIKEKEKAIFYATQARDKAAHYQHSEIGYNYRMSNICAGIGCGQMEVLEKHVALRSANHEFYKEIFRAIPTVRILAEPSEEYHSNHWLTAIILDSFATREKLRLSFEDANIETRPLWKPLHLQPVFDKYPYYGNSVAADLFEKGLCLPSSSNLNEADKKRIEVVINSFFSNLAY